ncbi:MAG TPA: hypothetical protein VFG77_07820 [Nitrososphaeraceae archaeon]|nr:hypothetical protein [Nitrososphaeraceae archaeon]
MHSSVHQLKITLGIRIAIVGQVKDLLLEIGAIIEKLKICELSQISTKIKQILQEEIQTKKITSRYVYEILPPKYKRQYRFQKELGSHYPGYYDIWTVTSLRKKISVEGSGLECQICLPLRWLKYKMKTSNMIFSNDSIWFKIDVDLDRKNLIYFDIGDGKRSPPLYCLPLHQDTNSSWV